MPSAWDLIFFPEELSLDNSHVALAWELTELREGLPWPQGVGMNVREVWHLGPVPASAV